MIWEFTMSNSFKNGNFINYSVAGCEKQYISLLFMESSSVFIFDFPINDGNYCSDIRYQLFYKFDTHIRLST